MSRLQDVPQLQALPWRRLVRCLQVEEGAAGVGLLRRSGLPMIAAGVWVLVLAAAGLPAVAAEPVPMKVVSVHDGDTLTALDASNVQHKIRLHGIDAPEIGQPFGTKSRDRLAGLAKGKTALVHVHDHDRYGRVVAGIEVAGDDLGHRLVSDGMAWHYTRYSKDAGLAAAQSEAQASGRGLWADKQPVPPWEWRATEKDRRRQPAGR